MYKPSSLTQRRNHCFRAAWYAAENGRFGVARYLLRQAVRKNIRPTDKQIHAVSIAAKQYVRSCYYWGAFPAAFRAWWLLRSPISAE